MSWTAHVRRVPAQWDERRVNDPKWRPRWKQEDCTHFQWWQDKTDPSPISPTFATVRELAQFAIDHADGRYLPFERDRLGDVLRYLRTSEQLDQVMGPAMPEEIESVRAEKARDALHTRIASLIEPVLRSDTTLVEDLASEHIACLVQIKFFRDEVLSDPLFADPLMRRGMPPQPRTRLEVWSPDTVRSTTT